MAYAKHTWQTGETITATKLNNIENGIATNDEAIGDVPEQIDAIQEELEMKANIDGAYESMTVGNAEQLVSTQFVEDNAPYVFRTSGGSADIGNREEDTIVGGTVAWNQMVTFEGGQASGEVTITKDDTNHSFTVTANSGVSYYFGYASNIAKQKTGHILLAVMDYSGTFSGNQPTSIRITLGTNASINQQSKNVGSDSNGKLATLFQLEGDWTRLGARVVLSPQTDSFAENDTFTIKNPQAYDLTQMFGSAVADAVYAMEQANAGSGVAWFKAQYPLDYYEFNSGELKSVEGLASHDMVGFNAWDEVWELGSISYTTGENDPSSDRFRSKNYIPVIAGARYYILHPEATARVMYYDASKTFIKSSATFSLSKEFVIPDNAHYIRFWQTGTTYNNDICINLSWSGTRNGEYEPYEKRSYALDSTLTLRGIPKIDADGQMYYDGDTYEADGTVTRKYGIVDLGTVTWRREGTAEPSLWYGSVPNAKGNKNIYGRTEICTKYVYNPSNLASDWASGMGRFGANTTNYNICDSAFNNYTADQVKSALSGVMLVYELATPTTEQAEPFTTPQIVEDWGTEEYVTTGLVAVGHNTKYPQNLRDKLQHLPELAEDDGAYLIQQTGTQMHLVNFRIPKAENLADGTYVLKATVSGGTPTYTWEAE